MSFQGAVMATPALVRVFRRHESLAGTVYCRGHCLVATHSAIIFRVPAVHRWLKLAPRSITIEIVCHNRTGIIKHQDQYA